MVRSLAAALVLIAATPACRPAEPGAAGAASGQGAPSEWEVLFDGGGLERWRGYGREEVPAGWRVEDGALTLVPGGEGSGGDLVTRDRYGDFELELEWRISRGGNSGIFYRATESEPWIYQSAPELQVLDDDGHPDGDDPLTSAGSNFGLYAPAADVTRPVGEWNQVRIVARGPRVEHWMNGVKLLEYDQGGADWRARVAASKFAQWPAYGVALEGHVGLQDHGNRVWFRNVRVRRLPPPG